MAAAPREDLERIIGPLGLLPGQDRVAAEAVARRWSRTTAARCRPRLDDLVKLPGRRAARPPTWCSATPSASPGITVDTHFGRLIRRLGWTEETDPVKAEHAIGALFPKRDWTMLSHHLIWHGRRVCHAKKPACGACTVARWCPSYGAGPTDPEAAAALVKTQGPA